jgi:arylsulfatase A-like enzyme
MNPSANWNRTFAWGVALPAALVVCADAPAPTRPSNVVIVTLDTTRPDRLPAYGFADRSMRALDPLAGEGVVFERAMSVAPLTLTAHCSLFTGLYPPHHHVRDNADAPLDGAQATLADVLHRRGFRTAAFVGSAILAPSRGLARGFDVYRDGAVGEPRMAPPRRPADQVVDEALDWLATGDDSPFMLWVHLYDAHAPYSPPEPYRSRYGPDHYEGAIAFAESQLARLLEALEARHLVERTAILVVGDHGESLGEHGEIEHGLFVYESAIRVPMILRSPGVTPQALRPAHEPGRCYAHRSGPARHGTGVR